MSALELLETQYKGELSNLPEQPVCGHHVPNTIECICDCDSDCEGCDA